MFLLLAVSQLSVHICCHQQDRSAKRPVLPLFDAASLAWLVAPLRVLAFVSIPLLPEPPTEPGALAASSSCLMNGKMFCLFG